MSHSIEILIMLLGAFLLGYWLSRVFSARDRARIARLEAQVTELLLAGVNVAPAIAPSQPLGVRATGAAEPESQREPAPAVQPTVKVETEAETDVEVEPKAPSKTQADAPAVLQAEPLRHTQPLAADRDDLKRIKGIGPNIETALNAGGITTFAALALAGEQDLRHMLVSHNPRFRIHDPASWPAQAAMARDGEWRSLEAWQKAARSEKK